MNQEGDVEDQIQLYGDILSVSGHTVEFERADGGGSFTIPFDGTLEEADPDAIYTLRASGEEVTSVSYVATYAIHRSGDADL